MTTMAVNVMARAPFGHAVTIQKISIAPITTNVRPALTKAGHQSATWSLVRRPASGRSGFPVSIESTDQADQHPGALVGEQPQRWRADRHCDQLPSPFAAEPSHAERVGHPR